MKLRPNEQRFWQRYLASVPAKRHPSRPFVEAAFAGNKRVTDRLIRLYIKGRKTAGSSLVRDFIAVGDPLPKPGNFWIVLDSRRRPQCLLQTVRVEINRFADIPRHVVIAEGEGNMSTAYWKRVHRKNYLPHLERWGISDLDDAEVITEHFDLLHVAHGEGFNRKRAEALQPSRIF